MPKTELLAQTPRPKRGKSNTFARTNYIMRFDSKIKANGGDSKTEQKMPPVNPQTWGTAGRNQQAADELRRKAANKFSSIDLKLSGPVSQIYPENARTDSQKTWRRVRRNRKECASYRASLGLGCRGTPLGGTFLLCSPSLGGHRRFFTGTSRQIN